MAVARVNVVKPSNQFLNKSYTNFIIPLGVWGLNFQETPYPKNLVATCWEGGSGAPLSLALAFALLHR